VRRLWLDRRTRPFLLALPAVLALVAGVLVVVAVSRPQQSAGVIFDADPLRTSWDSNEPSLPAGTVASSNFGQVFATRVHGQVYAQPLAIGSTIFVNTEDNWAYGLDAVTGTIKWSRSFGAPFPASVIGCADLSPNLGSTAAAAYDPTSDTVYMTTKVADGADAQHPNWYLQALDVATGAERPGWPVHIVGTPSNDPDHPFVARDVNQRPGLLLMNGSVYMAFGSQCDYGTYVGWVAGVNVATHAIHLWSSESGPTSEDGGMWAGGGGIVSDGSGRLFIATGNGVVTPVGPDSPVPKTLGNALVRLNVDASGNISAGDFFSPWNGDVLDENDQDLGSGGPVALPDKYFGTPKVPHLMVQIGKEGWLYLLDRDHLGGRAQGPGGTDGVVQKLGPYHGVWGRPAAYGGEGGYVYVLTDYDKLLTFKYGVTGDGRPALTQVSNSAETFGYTSGSPVVTSDDTKPGTGVVWVVNVDGPTGANGRLCAYDAVPTGGTMTLLQCFGVGTASKFAPPRAYNGRVYLGTRDGFVLGFGQPTAAALASTLTTFSAVNAGQTSTASVSVTATRTITVTGVTTAAPFTVTAPKLPVTLRAGQALSLAAAFAPPLAESYTGWITFSVRDGGKEGTLGAALSGTGLRPGFTATNASLDFGAVPVGSTHAMTVSFVNTGRVAERVSALQLPSPAFQVDGLPRVGQVVRPGGSVAVEVTYTPTRVRTDAGSITVTGPDGAGEVQLSASGVVGYSNLDIEPKAIHFAPIPVGLSETQVFTITNTGNLRLTITKAAPPALPFVVYTPLPEGQVVNPGDTMWIVVAYTPTAPGAANLFYTINADDRHGPHEVPVTGTAVTPPGESLVPNMLGGGWTYNGSASMAGSDLVLTSAAAQEAGSAIYGTPLPSDGLSATFTTGMSGGSGGDGMTFGVLDAASDAANEVGYIGGGLGFLGLTGVAVTLGTHQEPGFPATNFVGITNGGGGADQLHFLASSTNVPDLRAAPHQVQVLVGSGKVTVKIDGNQVLSAAVKLPASVLPAFTASTGTATDQHVVSAVAITSGGTTLPSPGTGWWFNGSAVMNGPEVVLTPAQQQLAGSAIYGSAVHTDGLTASFGLNSYGGTGADGISFVLLDPHTPPTSVGPPGGELGYGGLSGVAVSFLTYPELGVSATNWVAIATSSAGGTPHIVAKNLNIPQLRGGRSVVIHIAGTTITVQIDGVTVLSTSVSSLPATALPGFTASTGGSADVHTISGAGIVATPA
jgi:hypothetical protein